MITNKQQELLEKILKVLTSIDNNLNALIESGTKPIIIKDMRQE